MPTLMLMRHAEAEAVAPGHSDLDRPLTASGQLQAEATGDWLRSRAQLPDLVITSPAIRCRATTEALALTCPIVEEPTIHNAGSDTILQAVRERAGVLTDELVSVLVVGHAPGIPALVHDLCAYEQSSPEAAAQLERGWPPATVGLLAIVQPWAELRSARLLDVRMP